MKMLIVVSMMTQTFPGSTEKDSHIPQVQHPFIQICGFTPPPILQSFDNPLSAPVLSPLSHVPYHVL